MATATAPPAPVLDLTAFTERQFINITARKADGSTTVKSYELLNPTELSLRDQFWIERQSLRVAALLEQIGGDNVAQSVTASTDLTPLLERVCALTLMAPEAVRSVLSDAQRLAVFHAFLRLPAPGLTSAEVSPSAARPRGRSTGAKSSHGSRVSTAAPPTPGFRGRRSS